MNYERIYRELIADRRANPPSEDEYAEVHHILPRCMGGGDEPENLIRLRPADHFFAHLLLAKAHGGRLWAAVRIMAAAALGAKPEVHKKRLGKSMPTMRHKYSAARFWANEHLVGLGHPSADQTIYHFRHIDGREEKLARVEFCAKHGVDQSHINGLVGGRYKSARGWYLADRHTTETIGPPKGGEHPMADRKVYSFRHVDGREYSGTRYELAANDNVPPASVNAVVAGSCLSAYGWYLPENVPDGVVGRAAQSGERNSFADNNKYTFRHTDGTEETCTRHALVGKYDLNRGAFNAMMAGATLSSQGWYRVDLNPDGISGPPTAERNNKFNPTVHHFIHDDGREERLTLYAMHQKHGHNRASWNRCLSGGTCHGWRLYGSSPKRHHKSVSHTFYHVTGETFTGTQSQLARRHGFSDTCSWRIVNKGATSHGWSLRPLHANDDIRPGLFRSAA